MEGFKHHSLAALLLLSVLLVNLHNLDSVRAQDSLPSLVVDDGDAPFGSSPKDKEISPSASESNQPPAPEVKESPKEGDPKPDEPAPLPNATTSTTAATIVIGDSAEPKLISNKNDEETSKDKDVAPAKKIESSEESKVEEPKLDANSPAVNKSPENPASPKVEEEQEQKPSQSAPAVTIVSSSPNEPPPSSSSASPTTIKTEQDIKNLLENKNDAENDLSLSPVTTTTGAPAQPAASSDSSSVAIDLDGPVDTNKPVDDRFHYSFGNPSDKPAQSDEHNPDDSKPAVESDIKPTIVGKKDDEEPLGDKEDDKDEAPLEPKKVEEAPTTTTTTSTTTTTQAPSQQPKDSPIDAKSGSEEKPVANKPESGSESSIEAKKGQVDSKTEDKPVVMAAQAPASSDPAAEVPPQKIPVAEKDSNLDSKKQEADVFKSTTTAAPKKTEQSGEKTTSVSSNGPSGSDSALGAAFGSAVGSVLTQALSTTTTSKPQTASKSEPKLSTEPSVAVSSTRTTVVPPSSSSVSTPKVSSSTPRPSRRSSTTDRWNRWSRVPPVSTTSVSVGSTSSTVPPPRRRYRPTRRRFRPYNRFGPFPWGGADSYTPLGADESDFSPLDIDGASQSHFKPERPRATSTSRPKRRGSSSATTEPAQPTKSTDSRGGSTTAYDDFSPSTSSRRGSEVPHKRRHHHHHHRHHHNREYHDEQEPMAPNRPHQSYGHRHRFEPSHQNGRDTPSYFNIGEPSLTRPFSLFNSGASGLGSSTGSGFDLLNPFSWLDEVTKPRPPLHRPLDSSRPSLDGPVAVEGEYSSSGPHHGHQGDDSHEIPQGYGAGQRPPVRPIAGGSSYAGGHREDYDDYHDHHHDNHHGNHGHHDCHHDHEHEHDYHHDRDRPYRPHREPFNERPGRDDYGTYPSHGGRRPARPYQTRRDQLENATPASSNSSTRESESSSSPRPAGEERVGGEPTSHHKRERHESVSPRRVHSMVSPFDSLFGSLNEDFFGGLRSSFIDSPMKAAAETMRNTNTAFDAIISSPKILMPSIVVEPNGRAAKPPQAAVEKLDKDSSAEGKIDDTVEIGAGGGLDSRPAVQPRQDKPNLMRLFRLVL